MWFQNKFWKKVHVQIDIKIGGQKLNTYVLKMDYNLVFIINY